MIVSPAWAGRRYAVLGLARSGLATVAALRAGGADVVAWDGDAGRREALSAQGPLGEGVGGVGLEFAPQPPTSCGPALTHPNPSLEREGLLEVADPLALDLTGFAGVVVSPGVPLNRHPIAAHAASFGVPVIGDIELFAEARAALPAHKVVGITGTNGKSTTTALVHHMLKTAGVPSLMGGNIGLPILGAEPLPEGGVYVLELSSYQIDLTHSLDCDVAVLLNITPDHLDRYDSFDAYAASKHRLFAMQGTDSVRIEPDRRLCAEDPYDVWGAFAEDGRTHRDPRPLGAQPEWPALQGPHNAENALVAINVALTLGIDEVVVGRALRSFTGLPHRMERVGERNGVAFVNDSKATNAEAAAPALASFPAIRWILGGRAKSAELDACRPSFGNVRAAYTIGEAGPVFADLLRPAMPVTACGDLATAVRAAAAEAEAGDTVLLSPAAASFDQFTDFEARGRAFAELVEGLK